MKTLEEFGVSPAPWHIEKNTGVLCAKSERYKHPIVDDCGNFENNNDKRLIAAAPDLYEALVAMLRSVRTSPTAIRGTPSERLGKRTTKTKTRKVTQMSKNTEKKTLTDWDWTTLVASWRYYEHRHTIASAMFPHEIVKRFFTGEYDEESCKRIARQFVEIDHRNGPDDKISGWVGDDAFGASDRRAWRLFYFYLFAWHYKWFSKATVTLGGKSGNVEVFNADGKWYSREGYERFSADVSPYKVNEIEFVK